MAASLTFNIGKYKQDEEKEEFPIKNGKRCKVDIGYFTEKITELKDKPESIVLTLLKEDDEPKKFSLSIKLNNNNKKINKETSNLPIFGGEKHIYINANESINKLYKLPEVDIEPTHILIIGTATEDNKTSFTFTATKSIFFINTTEQQLTEEISNTFQTLLTIEEFLNLRYIDYFSFDNDKFNQLYKGNSQGGGGISKKKNKSK